MSLISPNFDVKLIIFPNFGQGPFPKIAGKVPALILPLYRANSVDPEQTAPIGAVWSGSTVFAIEAS